MRSTLTCLALAAVSGTLFVAGLQAEEKKVPLDKLPKVVTDAVKKMFPKAELIEAASEEQDGKIEYEVTIKEKGKNIDVTVQADGTIETLEKEIDLKDLPKVVTDTLKKMYPKAVAESAEAVYEIEDGKEELDFYEVVLKDGDKEIEARINADGSVHKDDDDKDEKK